MAEYSINEHVHRQGQPDQRDRQALRGIALPRPLRPRRGAAVASRPPGSKVRGRSQRPGKRVPRLPQPFGFQREMKAKPPPCSYLPQLLNDRRTRAGAQPAGCPPPGPRARVTAGSQAAQAKNNEQLPAGCEPPGLPAPSCCGHWNAPRSSWRRRCRARSFLPASTATAADSNRFGKHVDGAIRYAEAGLPVRRRPVVHHLPVRTRQLRRGRAGHP